MTKAIHGLASPSGDIAHLLRFRFLRLKPHLVGLLLLALCGQAAAANVVEYSYDAAGNITQIRRQAATGLAITGVDPGSGAVGAAVTVYGSGFSPTPANNTVRFNGTQATVSVSDSGSLVTAVPAGATTGRITVTVGAATATSPLDFVVVVPGVPTVSAFTPAAAAANEVIAVTGTHFEPPASVTAKLGATTVAASVTSPSSLTFSVPPSSGSGRISVTNPSGTGTSAQDLIVLPTGYAATDLETVLRLSPGAGGSAFQIGTASKFGVILFDGQQDGYYTVQFGQLAHSPSNAAVNFKVLNPDNSQLAAGNVGSGYRPTIHLPKLPSTGTYAIFVSPGVATMFSQVSVAADPVLGIDGAAGSFAMGSPSQSTRSVLTVSAGQALGFGVTAFAHNGSTSSATGFKVIQPSGALVGGGTLFTAYSPWSATPQGNWDGEFRAAEAGTHLLIAEPPWGYAASYGVQVSSEVSGTLTADTPVELSLTRVGQDARFTFAAVPGDNLAMELSGVSPQPALQSIAVRVLRPDGVLFKSGTVSSPLYGTLIPLGALPAAGNYAVEVDPSYGNYGTARVALKRGPLLSTTDPPTAFSTAVTGESARFRFQATAGQNLSLALSGLAYAGTSSSYASLTVFKPDGTSLTYNNCYPSSYGGRCKITLANLPSTGEYSVAVQPPAGVTLTGNVSLSADQTGTLADNVPVALSVTRPGQNVRYTFAGTAGQSSAIELAQLVPSPSGPSVYVYVLKPDGTILTSSSATANGVFVNLPSLPVTGTYTVLVDAAYGIAFDARLTLDPGASLAIDGDMPFLSTAVNGETLRFTFQGTAGAMLELGLNGLAYNAASSSAMIVNVYRPDGASVAGAYCYTSTAGGGCEVTMPAALPSTGTYSLTAMAPAGYMIAGGTLALSTRATGTLVIGDSSQPIVIARPGQTARYAFSGTAGQLLRLNWTGTVVSIPGVGMVSVNVLKPDGSTLTSSSFGTGATGGVDIASLPATGTYTVVFNPSYAATMTAPVTLVTR